MRYDTQILHSMHNENECFVHFSRVSAESPLSLVQFGFHKTPAGYGYGPTIRDHYLLHFVKGGTGIVQAHNTEYRINSGNIFAIYPHQITYYESSRSSPWEYYWIGFDGKWAKELMSRIGFENDQQIAVKIIQPESVFNQLEEIHALVKNLDDIDRNLIALTGQTMTLLHSVSVMPQDSTQVERREAPGILGHEYTRILLSIIATSYSEHISVQELARRLNLNRTYMSKLFKQDTGSSIRDYLADYRMGRAELMLLESHHTIGNIALSCGYEDALYFSRAFRKKHGVSPREWRQAHGKL